MTDLNRIKPAFRTSGAMTGNFGKQKVKAGSRLNDIGHTNVERVVVTTEDEYVRKLRLALDNTTDPKLINFINTELRRLHDRSISAQKRVVHGRTAEPFRPAGC